jgi:hypothetical protein
VKAQNKLVDVCHVDKTKRTWTFFSFGPSIEPGDVFDELVGLQPVEVVVKAGNQIHDTLPAIAKVCISAPNWPGIIEKCNSSCRKCPPYYFYH